MGRETTVRLLAIAGVLLLAGCAGRSSVSATAAVKPSLGPCTEAAAAGPDLDSARTAITAVGGSPFGVAVSPDGRYSFVSGFAGTGFRTSGAYVDVLSDDAFAPKVVRRIGLGVPDAAGDALTPDGRYLLVATWSGAAVIDVAKAERGVGRTLVGFLSSPESSGNGIPRFPAAKTPPEAPIAAGAGGSAIEVTTSPDGRFAFVSLEYQDEVAVFDLREAIASGFRHSGYVGAITLGQAVVGMAVSPDGRWLYATSELAAGAHPAFGRTGLVQAYGSVSVIELRRAETRPASSVVSTAPAGCGSVRVAVSPDGQVVWVTARESDALLAFSASKLVSDPKHALIARVRVGEAPVGLAVVDGGARIVVADSNRFQTPGEISGLTVVDTAAALAGKPALVGKARAGLFPRELALEPNGRTLLVTNFESGRLEALDVEARAIRS